MNLDPLVPEGADIRGFQFMPIDVTRLLTSETWIMATGDERSAAMNLWLQSWQQVPAGSLPNNDRVLAHLSMAGQLWPQVREMALRGWIECSDGRLYHPVVCEKVNEALKAQKQRRGAIEKRWGKRSNNDRTQAEHRAEEGGEYGPYTGRITEPDTPVIQERGRGNREEREASASLSCAIDEPPAGVVVQLPEVSAQRRRPPDELDAEFREFYSAYPRKKDPEKARQAYIKARKKAPHSAIMQGLSRYAAECNGRDPQYIKHPSSWLNAGAWQNEPDAANEGLEINGRQTQSTGNDRSAHGALFAGFAAAARRSAH